MRCNGNLVLPLHSRGGAHDNWFLIDQGERVGVMIDERDDMVIFSGQHTDLA